MIEFDSQDADVQEARSNFHAATLRILALSSGKFAVFSRGSVLHGIYDTLREEVIRALCEDEMRDYLASMQAEREYRGAERPHPIPAADAKNPEDMGL